ncbi:2141_t:CDS:2, partial [Entrophospora sp. SA101]
LRRLRISRSIPRVIYQESEYSESIQTAPDYSTLFESSEENSGSTETYSDTFSSGGAQYVTSDLDGVTTFTIEGKTFQEGLGQDWHCTELGLKYTEKGDKLYIPVKALYERKEKEKEEFKDDKDEFDEDEMKILLAKKTNDLSEEEQEKVISYQKHHMLETQKKLAELTQAHDRRERELAKQRNKSIFDTVAEYLEKNQTEMVKVFKAAGLGGKETKWSEFPKFEGGEDDPYEWLDQYEAACEVNGVKGNRMLDLLSTSLEGPALSWWRSARKTTITWEAWKSEYKRKRSFKYQFLTKFCGPERQQRWMEELRNCKQRPGETVSEYYSKLQTLYRKADPAKQYPERDNYQQFLKGLRSELRTAVRLAAASNLREAVERAKAAEAAYSMDGSLAGYSLVKKHDEELHKELKELKELLTKSAQETCDLCYKKGHQAAECPQRSLKISTQQKKNCKACGKTGHWTKECTKTRTCYSCGQLGHFANQCPHTAQFKQILQRNDQQQPPKKVFIAQQNQLDPEDQEQNYIYQEVLSVDEVIGSGLAPEELFNIDVLAECIRTIVPHCQHHLFLNLTYPKFFSILHLKSYF